MVSKVFTFLCFGDFRMNFSSARFEGERHRLDSLFLLVKRTNTPAFVRVGKHLK